MSAIIEAVFTGIALVVAAWRFAPQRRRLDSQGTGDNQLDRT